MNFARTRRSIGAACAVAVAAVTSAAVSAAALPTAVYRASVSPASATAGSGTFTVTLTDCGVVSNQVICNPAPLIAFDNMDRATVTLTDAPGTVVAVSPSTWSATVSGSVVTLQANGTANDLTVGQSVSVTLPVPTRVGTDSISTAATDATGFSFTRDGSDPTLAVGPGAVASLGFGQQPTETPAKAAIAPPVTVNATDAYGNPTPGVPVTVSLGQNSAGGTLSGTLTEPADGTGTATFSNLSIDQAGFGYTLLAKSGAASTQSAPFTVSTTSTLCTSYPCTGSATDTAGTTTTTATLTGLSAPSDLSLTMYSPTLYAPPANACGTSGFEGSGTKVDVTGGGGTPTKTLTWRLDKSIVNQTPNNGAAQYSVCMGAFNTANPGQSWVTKNGGQAVLEADGMFWGVLPACGSVPAGQPCITSQSKNGEGDVVIAMSVPSPWDEQFVGGLLSKGAV